MPPATNKLPKRLTRYNVDPHLLQEQLTFLGFSSGRTHPSAYHYLLGHAGGQAIINPEHTLVALRRVLNLLKKVSFRGGRTLFVSTTPTLARLCRVVGEQSGQFYLARKWVPGMLTNWKKSREHVHNKLRPDPLLQAAGKLKYSDLQKANYYRGVEHMTRPPDLIVRLDGTPLYGEPARVNVPLVSVVDSDTPSEEVDYPIPANTNSLRFYHTLAQMLVRAANEGAALRAELDAYGVQAEVSDADGQRHDQRSPRLTERARRADGGRNGGRDGSGPRGGGQGGGGHGGGGRARGKGRARDGRRQDEKPKLQPFKAPDRFGRTR